MEEEKVMKLAESLKKNSLVASMKEAVERAKSILGVKSIQEKAAENFHEAGRQPTEEENSNTQEYPEQNTVAEDSGFSAKNHDSGPEKDTAVEQKTLQELMDEDASSVYGNASENEPGLSGNSIGTSEPIPSPNPTNPCSKNPGSPALRDEAGQSEQTPGDDAGREYGAKASGDDSDKDCIETKQTEDDAQDETAQSGEEPKWNEVDLMDARKDEVEEKEAIEKDFDDIEKS